MAYKKDKRVEVKFEVKEPKIEVKEPKVYTKNPSVVVNPNDYLVKEVKA